MVNQSKINLARLSSTGVSNRLIAAGDLLEVTIASGQNDEKLVPILIRVSDDGTADLPAIGMVQIAGFEPYEASHRIVTASIDRGIYRKPSITLEVKSKAVNHITILGEVDNPGVHEIPRNASDLVRALGAAGGLTEDASTSIEIIRHAPTTLANNSKTNDSHSDRLKHHGDDDAHTMEVKQAAYAGLSDNTVNLIDGSSSLSNIAESSPLSERIDLADRSDAILRDNRLADRDIVMVHKREKRLIYVEGLVKKPGQFELPSEQDVHLLDSIALAGGINSVVADKVYVIRRIEGKSQPLVIRASLRMAKRDGNENLRLAEGDTVSVEQTPATVVVDTFTKLFRVAFGVSGNFAGF